MCIYFMLKTELSLSQSTQIISFWCTTINVDKQITKGYASFYYLANTTPVGPTTTVL